MWGEWRLGNEGLWDDDYCPELAQGCGQLMLPPSLQPLLESQTEYRTGRQDLMPASNAMLHVNCLPKQSKYSPLPQDEDAGMSTQRARLRGSDAELSWLLRTKYITNEGAEQAKRAAAREAAARRAAEEALLAEGHEGAIAAIEVRGRRPFLGEGFSTFLRPS